MKKFVLWYPEWLEDKKKWTKIPCNKYGYKIDPHDEKNHLSYEDAKQTGRHVGMVFSEADDYFFIDLDHQYKNGQWSELAQQLCVAFKGCYIEVSYSGDGLHIIGKYSRIAPHRSRRQDLGLELYHTERFCALTGTNAQGSMDHDATPQLEWLINTIFPPDAESQHSEWTNEPREDARPIEDDDELIKAALKSKSAAGVFGGGATFKQLWEADAEILAKVYPPSDTADQAWGYSEADAALAQHLAFWTGCNCERIAELMRRSALYRDKYDARDDYLPRTIMKACGRQREVFKRTEVVEVNPAEGPQSVEGFQYLVGDQQLQHFAGCVYITEMHRVLTPKGKFLRPEQFNAQYGGFTFAIDMDRKTTTKAFEAFTQSQLIRFPKVDCSMFKPKMAFCEIIERGNDTMVNTYKDPRTPRKKGDVTPFLTHLAKLLPDQTDQEILLSYMAACVQHKGIKFQWAPLLQGVEGNGKTLMSQCLIESLGPQYAHMPKAKLLDSPFNGWLLNKLFIGVEDIYVPGGKMDLLETLKPMITGKRQEIQLKGVDQFTTEICANFIFNSNHQDAIKKTVNDRRFAIFFTAQQYAADLAEDGMGGDYFPRLYGWLDEDGYAIVHEFLASWAIPSKWNPAGACHRAPRTSSHDAAIEASYSPLEARLRELIDDGVEGFRGGFISLDAARLKTVDLNVSDRYLGIAIQSLGYEKAVRLRRGDERIRLHVHSENPAKELSGIMLLQEFLTKQQCPGRPG